ncbi:MAG: hypothetical protein SPF88_00155, partial [Schaalia hyovaginalis]
YSVANSNAMNGLAPGATVTYTPPTWKYIQYGASALVLLGILGGAYGVARRVREVKAPGAISVDEGE